MPGSSLSGTSLIDRDVFARDINHSSYWGVLGFPLLVDDSIHLRGGHRIVVGEEEQGRDTQKVFMHFGTSTLIVDSCCAVVGLQVPSVRAVIYICNDVIQLPCFCAQIHGVVLKIMFV